MTSLANRFFTNRSESNIPREGFRSQRRIYCCFLGCQSFRNRKMRKPFFLMLNEGIEVIWKRLIDLHHMCLLVAGVCDMPLLCCIPNFFLIICLYGCFSFPFPLLWAKGCPADGFSNSCDMTVTFQTTFYEQTYGCSVFFSL